MKAQQNIKAFAFDWLYKILIGLLCFLVKDMHGDIKQLMQTVPALRAEVDILKDQRLVDKFRNFYQQPAKGEEEITFDSLKRK